MQQVSADLSKLTTKQSLSRYNLDSRLDNVINTGNGLESIYGQQFLRKLDIINVRAIYKASIGIGLDGSVNSGNLYILAENQFWMVTPEEDSEPILCGEITTSNGTVTFAESQGQNLEGIVYIYFCDGMSLYRLNALTLKPEIENLKNALPMVNGTDNVRGQPSFISYRSHRLLLTCLNSTQFFYSETNPDKFAKNSQEHPLDKMFPSDNFYSTETKADRTLRIIGLDLIYAFGTKTIEVWRDNNDAYDPYTTSINGNYLSGLSSPHAVAILHNEIYYFDDLLRLCRLSSGRLEVLSDRSNERIWDGKKFNNAFVIYVNGCFIACFQATDGFTIGYNTKSGSISELSCLSNVRAVSEEYLCDTEGNLCAFNDHTYTMANGNVISKIIQLEVLHNLKRFSLQSIMIDYSIKTIPDEAEINNQVFLFVSPDGLNWRDARVLNLDMHTKTIKSFGFGLCSKMHARLVFTNANPVVFNSFTFIINGGTK